MTTQLQQWDNEEELQQLRLELKRAHNEIGRLRTICRCGDDISIGRVNVHSKLWIFGYGSLVYNPGATRYDVKVPAFIKGMKRRFYQGSTDHRGTPESPGRVVTILPSRAEDAYVWGVAYRIVGDTEDEALQYLNYREKDGYTSKKTKFYLEDGSVGGYALVYYASSTNGSYLGKLPYSQVAQKISESEGPSGKNIEYFNRLNIALLSSGVRDKHLYKIRAAMMML